MYQDYQKNAKEGTLQDARPRHLSDSPEAKFCHPRAYQLNLFNHATMCFHVRTVNTVLPITAFLASDRKEIDADN